jgi:hypothetical protein
LASFSCSPPSGSTFPGGTTTVTCQARDTSGNANSCSFKVAVNNPPVAALGVSCAYTNGTNLYVIAIEKTNACMVLDGTGSHDPNHDALDYRWIVDGTNVYSGPMVTNCMAAGCHSVIMIVGDGRVASVARTNVCVISAADAVGQCIAMVDSSTVARKDKRPLLATLKEAAAGFDRGQFKSAMNNLEAFEHKASAGQGKKFPTETAAFVACAQTIIDALNCLNNLSEHGVGIDDDKKFPDNDNDSSQSVAMCHDGETQLVSAGDVARRQAQGWTIGACSGRNSTGHDR